MTDIAVAIGWTLRILAGFANKRRRGDNGLEPRGARVSLVEVQWVVVADCEREVSNGRAADLFRRFVNGLAADPVPQLVCEQCVDANLSYGPFRRLSAGSIARESTSIRYSGRSSLSHTHPVETGNGVGRVRERTPATSR